MVQYLLLLSPPTTIAKLDVYCFVITHMKLTSKTFKGAVDSGR